MTKKPMSRLDEYMTLTVKLRRDNEILKIDTQAYHDTIVELRNEVEAKQRRTGEVRDTCEAREGDWLRENETLKGERDDLRARVADLEDDNDRLRAERNITDRHGTTPATLRAEVERLKREFNALYDDTTTERRALDAPGGRSEGGVMQSAEEHAKELENAMLQCPPETQEVLRLTRARDRAVALEMLKDLKRYDPDTAVYGEYIGMEACDEGDWVSFDDLEAYAERLGKGE